MNVLQPQIYKQRILGQDRHLAVRENCTYLKYPRPTSRCSFQLSAGAMLPLRTIFKKPASSWLIIKIK